MFFDAGRISSVRQMILAEDEATRRRALDSLLPDTARRFHCDLSKIMAGLPVTIRLLDPPLHEFLPHGDAEFAELSEADRRRRRDHWQAPRGRTARVQSRCSATAAAALASPSPRSAEMQARAIFEAACDVAERAATRRSPKS